MWRACVTCIKVVVQVADGFALEPHYSRRLFTREPDFGVTSVFDLGLSPREVAVGVGLVRTVTPMGSAIGPPLVGVLQESTGSLETALYWVLPASVTVGIIGLLLPETSPLRNRGRRGGS